MADTSASSVLVLIFTPNIRYSAIQSTSDHKSIASEQLIFED